MASEKPWERPREATGANFEGSVAERQSGNLTVLKENALGYKFYRPRTRARGTRTRGTRARDLASFWLQVIQARNFAEAS